MCVHTCNRYEALTHSSSQQDRVLPSFLFSYIAERLELPEEYLALDNPEAELDVTVNAEMRLRADMINRLTARAVENRTRLREGDSAF